MAKPKGRKATRNALPPEFANFEPPITSFDEIKTFLNEVQQLDSRPSMGERFAAATASASMDQVCEVARGLAKGEGEGLEWVVDLFIETAENLDLRRSLVYAAMAKLEVVCDRMER